MTIGLDRAPAGSAEAAGQLPELTPEKARELAAVLAQHMVAMRAVTAGTRYGDRTGPGPQPLSPATEIFLAGMLDRIRADEQANAASAACSGSDDAATSGLALLAG